MAAIARSFKGTMRLSPFLVATRRRNVTIYSFKAGLGLYLSLGSRRESHTSIETNYKHISNPRMIGVS